MRCSGTTSRTDFIDNLPIDRTYRNGHTVSNRSWAGEDYNQEETTGGRVTLLYDFNENWRAIAAAMTQASDTVGAWDHDPTRRDDLEVARFGPEYTNLNYAQYAFTVTGELDIGDLVYATSYYDRDDLAVNDYSDYVEYASFGNWIQQHACENFYWYGFTGCADPSIFFESEANTSRWSHELRLASSGEGRLNWIGGAYYETRALRRLSVLGDAGHQLRERSGRFLRQRCGRDPTAARMVELPWLEGIELLLGRLWRHLLGLHRPPYGGSRHAGVPRRGR